MAGETNLNKLLASMSSSLMPEEFVFCTFPDSSYGDHSDLKPLASMNEAEGLTLVIERTAAERQNFTFDTVLRCIALNVRSSLDAVGLTAAFANKLSESGISANVIAGFYHDHIFVPHEMALQAMAALEELSLSCS